MNKGAIILGRGFHAANEPCAVKFLSLSINSATASDIIRVTPTKSGLKNKIIPSVGPALPRGPIIRHGRIARDKKPLLEKSLARKPFSRRAIKRIRTHSTLFGEGIPGPFAESPVANKNCPTNLFGLGIEDLGLWTYATIHHPTK
jgi:hypothetical protein